MPDVAIEGMTWLDDYDAYYYDRDRRLSLPVLRVRYSDPPQTWLYFDPRRGGLARKEERLTRLERRADPIVALLERLLDAIKPNADAIKPQATTKQVKP